MQTNNNLIAKNKKLKIIHIIILVIGAIFMIGSGLHTNIWFDETYTVGLVNHSFVDIAKIGAADVHFFIICLLNFLHYLQEIV